MKIFIDFDDTLFDSKRLKDDLFSTCPFLSESEMRQAYAEFRSQQNFSLHGFAEFLETKNIKAEDVIKHFQKFLSDTSKYVHDDAITFLEKLIEKKYDLYLLTVDADIERWQKPKIKGSGLVPYFQEILITPKDKVSLLQSLSQQEPFIFIDDKQSEIDAMYSAYPQAICLKHELGAPLLSLLQYLP